MHQETDFEIIIIGGSYAGLSAAMALGRALRSTLVIDSGHPCNEQTPYSHNFLTNDGKIPRDITSVAKYEVSQYRNVQFLQAAATIAHKTKNGFEVTTGIGSRITTRKIIFATGIKDVLPSIDGLEKAWGTSVLHCPYCHGYEFRDQATGILANGDVGYELASLISNWTKDLTVYTNGPASFTNAQAEKLQQHNIHVVDGELQRLEHSSGYIHRIIFRDGTASPVKALYTRPPFVQHSDIPFSLGCDLTPDGYIKTDAANQTTEEGVYACGDNTSKMRTISNAVAMGTTTGIMVNKQLIEDDF